MAATIGARGNEIEADVLVLGSGMAGMTAAAVAAEQGLSVVVAEKATQPGGSARIAGSYPAGFMWTTPSLEALMAEDPYVDQALVRVLADDFLPAMEWVRALGVRVSDLITGIYRFGHGFQVDVHGFLDRCREVLEVNGGRLLVGVTANALSVSDGTVTGAEFTGQDGGRIVIKARETVLATGGFQGSSELRAQLIAPEARDLLLRANPTSDGAGLRLAQAVGGLYVDGRHGFYGHLMPYPLTSFVPDDFISAAMLHSGFCLLLDGRGTRFTDESLGDHENNQAVLTVERGRALLVADDHVRRERIMAPYIPGMVGYDKFELAETKGAHVVTDAPTLEELGARVSDWGYDGVRVAATIAKYNELADDAPTMLQPPSSRHCRPLDVAPFFAMEVQPAITFSYGGIRADATSRVMGSDGAIPGLLAAGVDIGGIYTRAYAGGLSRGLVFGRRAALTATGKES